MKLSNAITTAISENAIELPPRKSQTKLIETEIGTTSLQCVETRPLQQPVYTFVRLRPNGTQDA